MINCENGVQSQVEMNGEPIKKFSMDLSGKSSYDNRLI